MAVENPTPKVLNYFKDAIAAKVRGSILSCRRSACFSPGESLSLGLVDLDLGVNLDFSRAERELVVEVLRREEVSEVDSEALRSEVVEDIVVVVGLGFCVED
jgi:hypothetical protein